MPPKSLEPDGFFLSFQGAGRENQRQKPYVEARRGFVFLKSLLGAELITAGVHKGRGEPRCAPLEWNTCPRARPVYTENDALSDQRGHLRSPGDPTTPTPPLRSDSGGQNTGGRLRRPRRVSGLGCRGRQRRLQAERPRTRRWYLSSSCSSRSSGSQSESGSGSRPTGPGPVTARVANPQRDRAASPRRPSRAFSAAAMSTRPELVLLRKPAGGSGSGRTTSHVGRAPGVGRNGWHLLVYSLRALALTVRRGEGSGGDYQMRYRTRLENDINFNKKIQLPKAARLPQA